MQLEVDLRPYIEGLITRWYWIICAVVLGSGLGVVLASTSTPTYSAQSILIVTQGRDLVQFDGRLREQIGERQTYRAFPELALSDSVLNQLLPQVQAQDDAIQTLGQLRGLLHADLGDDPSIVRLSVRYKKPEVTAVIANLWAKEVTKWVATLESDRSQEDILGYQTQLIEAENELQIAGTAIINFQTVNSVAVVSNTLTLKLQEYNQLLQETTKLTSLQLDVTILQTQLESSNAPLPLANQITALLLEMQKVDSQVEMPLTIDVTQGDLIGESYAEQARFVENLNQSVTSQLLILEEKQTAVQPDILHLQGELTRLKLELERLELAKKVALSKVEALTFQVAEDSLAQQNTSSYIRVASEASTPLTPVAPSRTLLMLSGAMIGLLFGVLFTLLWVYRRG